MESISASTFNLLLFMRNPLDISACLSPYQSMMLELSGLVRAHLSHAPKSVSHSALAMRPSIFFLTCLLILPFLFHLTPGKKREGGLFVSSGVGGWAYSVIWYTGMQPWYTQHTQVAELSILSYLGAGWNVSHAYHSLFTQSHTHTHT